MKKLTLFSLACCFAVTAAVLDAQDTRITPGVPTKITGIKTSQDDGQDDAEKNGECSEGASCESSSCSGEECPVMVKAMEALPKLVFRIGDEETCCHMTATRMAHEAHDNIVYMVGKKKYHESRDAFEALVRQTEMYVKKFVKPKICEESKTTTIAGETCRCSNMAARLNESIVAAIDDLKIAYRVGEKEFDKYHDARRFAKKTHQNGVYMVGKEKFEDEYEARLALAHQKYRQAIQAIQSAKSESSAENPTTDVAASDG